MYLTHTIFLICCSIAPIMTSWAALSTQELKTQLIHHIVATDLIAFTQTMSCFCAIASAQEQEKISHELREQIATIRAYLTARIDYKRSHMLPRVFFGITGGIEMVVGLAAAEVYRNYNSKAVSNAAPLKNLFHTNPDYRSKAWLSWGTHALVITICATILRFGFSDLLYAYNGATGTVAAQLTSLEQIAQLVDEKISPAPIHAIPEAL